MRYSVFDALQKIQARRSFEFAKIVEKLLAISFGPRRAGFQVENRSIEGVDIFLLSPAEKYAVEVKTTIGHEIILGKKDVSGLLQEYERDKYLPCIAVLRIDLLENWVVANAAKLEAIAYTPARLSLYSIPNLEDLANRHFGQAILDFLPNILSPPDGKPLTYLTQVLEAESASEHKRKS